jgi:hypothetical protein
MEDRSIFEVPKVYQRIDIVQFESFADRPNRGTISGDTQPPGHYSEVVGRLKGYMIAANLFDNRTNGDVTKGTKPAQWMQWLLSYCRANPSQTVMQTAEDLFLKETPARVAPVGRRNAVCHEACL